MAAPARTHEASPVIAASEPVPRSQHAALLVISTAIALLHIATNNRYGFHRDELQFLSDARHLDWGYVSYPPFTPFVERVGLAVFGLSLLGLALFQFLGGQFSLQYPVPLLAGLLVTVGVFHLGLAQRTWET